MSFCNKKEACKLHLLRLATAAVGKNKADFIFSLCYAAKMSGEHKSDATWCGIGQNCIRDRPVICNISYMIAIDIIKYMCYTAIVSVKCDERVGCPHSFMCVTGVIMGKKRVSQQSAAEVEQIVEGLVIPILLRHNASLWTVDFALEAGNRYLRILLDRDAPPVDLDLCEAVSRELDKLLDEVDPIEESYYLEVGSAGLDRPLKRPSDFDLFVGRLVDVSLYAPLEICGKKQKHFAAKLLGLSDGVLTLQNEDGTEFTLSHKSAASVKLAILFD